MNFHGSKGMFAMLFRFFVCTQQRRRERDHKINSLDKPDKPKASSERRKKENR